MVNLIFSQEIINTIFRRINKASQLWGAFLRFASSSCKLGNDILERMRIKKVLLKIQGKQWKVLAEINPLFVIMSGPMPDEDVMSIKKDKADVPKGLKKGDIYFDDQGRELMKISRLDEFTRTPDYREIFALAKRADISNDVIHHLIEKGSDFAYLFEKELINAPKSLRAIPQGIINDVVHLSKIRTMWDTMYRALDLNKDILQMTDQQIVNSFINFANYTDEFFEASFRYTDEMGERLSKEGLQEFTDQWLRNSPMDLAAESAVENAIK